MKPIFYALLLLVILPCVSCAALSSLNVTLISSGGLIVNGERSWHESDVSNGFLTGGNQYNEGTSDLVYLTGPGNSRIDTSESTNHTLDNVFDSSIIATTTGGYAYAHGAYMGDQQPAVPDIECSGGNIIPQEDLSNDDDNTFKTYVKGANPSYQTVEVSKYGVGQGMYTESDIIVENANVTSSTRGEVGLGNLMEDISTRAMAGFNKSETTLNYDKSERSHVGVFGNETGSGQIGIDFKWRDHSHPYGIGADESEIYTVNITDST